MVRMTTHSRHGVAALAVLLASILVLAPAARGEAVGTTAFDHPGTHDFRVPDGIYWLTVKVEGGHGGSGDAIAPGGHGGGVTTTIPVTPQETLKIHVGGYGGGHGGEGWSHGGDHGTADGALNDCATAGGGGGSSAVARGSTLLVGAGGGGGGGGDCGSVYGGAGGDGGKVARGGRNSPEYEPPDTGTGGCGACASGERGADGHNATEDETGGGGGGGGGGATRGGAGGEDGTVGFGHAGSGGGGGGAGDSTVAAAGALQTAYFITGRGHDGAVTLTWGNQATQMTAVAGNGQAAQIMGAFTTGLRAKVTDSRGIPAVGVDVRFEVPDSGAAGTFGGAADATAKTGRDGIAAAPPLHANAIAGEWYAVASVPGTTADARFALENDAASSTTSLSSDANPSVTGQPVVLSAAVRSSVSSAPATGHVQFVVDGAPSGDPVDLVAGVATAPALTGLAPGDHPIEARYLGDAGHDPSTGSAPDQHVDPAPTATSVASSLNPSGVGDSVVFTATVAVRAPASGTPDGTVQFTRDGAPLGGPVTLDAGGTAASDPVGFTAEGAAEIEATYTPAGGADPRFAASAGSMTQSVGAEATATEVSTSVNPAAAGEPIVLSAQVRRQDAGIPAQGEMTFLVDGAIACPPTTVVGATANCTLPSTLAPGPHAIRAQFTGAPGYDDSHGTLTQQIVPAATRTVVSAQPDPSPYGVAVRLRAIVGVVAPGTGTPSGTVQFLVDGTALGAPVAVDAGVATSSAIPDLPIGSHAIEADFAPSGPYSPSHALAGPVVDSVATTTTLASSADPAIAGRDLRFTVTVAPAQGAARPVGEIQLLVDGGAYGAPIPLVGGRAVAPPVDDLDAGTHVVAAHYHGYGPFESSTATLQQQIINPPSGGGQRGCVHVGPHPGPAGSGRQRGAHRSDTAGDAGDRRRGRSRRRSRDRPPAGRVPRSRGPALHRGADPPAGAGATVARPGHRAARHGRRRTARGAARRRADPAGGRSDPAGRTAARRPARAAHRAACRWDGPRRRLRRAADVTRPRAAGAGRHRDGARARTRSCRSGALLGVARRTLPGHGARRPARTSGIGRRPRRAHPVGAAVADAVGAPADRAPRRHQRACAGDVGAARRPHDADHQADRGPGAVRTLLWAALAVGAALGMPGVASAACPVPSGADVSIRLHRRSAAGAGPRRRRQGRGVRARRPRRQGARHGPGRPGGTVYATVPVTAGQCLDVYVGGYGGGHGGFGWGRGGDHGTTPTPGKDGAPEAAAVPSSRGLPAGRRGWRRRWRRRLEYCQRLPRRRPAATTPTARARVRPTAPTATPRSTHIRTSAATGASRAGATAPTGTVPRCSASSRARAARAAAATAAATAAPGAGHQRPEVLHHPRWRRRGGGAAPTPMARPPRPPSASRTSTAPTAARPTARAR